MKKPRTYIVGVGPGDPNLVTPQAQQVLKICTAILSWELNLKPVKRSVRGKRLFLQDATNYVVQAKEAAETMRRGGGSLGIVRIGDPTVSSGLAGIMDMMPDFDFQIVPGIGAAQVAACRTGIELHRAVLISFHDDDKRNEAEKRFMLAAWESGRHLILFSGPSMMPENTAQYLILNGVPADTPCWVGEWLTLPEEKQWAGTLKEMASRSFSWLSVVVIGNPTEGGLRLFAKSPKTKGLVRDKRK